jgi:hypothetical protein
MTGVIGHLGGGLDDLGYPREGPQVSRVTVGTRALLQLSCYVRQLSIVEPGEPPRPARSGQALGTVRLPVGVPAAHALAADSQFSGDVRLGLSLPEQLPCLLAALFQPDEVPPRRHTDRCQQRPAQPQRALSTYGKSTDLPRTCHYITRSSLGRHRAALKNRIHSSLLAFGHSCPVPDLFGLEGRALLARLEFPEPWLGDIGASLRPIDAINFQITEIEDELVADGLDHAHFPLLRSAPGVGHVLGHTIAAEIGDIARFASPTKLVRLHGTLPTGLSVRRGRPPWQSAEKRPEVPPLGAH